MKRKSMRAFIRENRAEIDAYLHRENPDGLRRLNDNDRELCIRNDEPLYLWAKRSGVNV